ncbi:hypothetical protein Tco_1015730 [Tanacetum coccineum]|uniref:Uncharacterized protein n=1 Tax=Tanacetum coccineum TaxID=301880 RepID=A0ABQ5FLM0_9ASTR
MSGFTDLIVGLFQLIVGLFKSNEDLGIEASYSRLRTPAFEDLGDSFMVDLSSYMEESVESERTTRGCLDVASEQEVIA